MGCYIRLKAELQVIVKLNRVALEPVWLEISFSTLQIVRYSVKTSSYAGLDSLSLVASARLGHLTRPSVLGIVNTKLRQGYARLYEFWASAIPSRWKMKNSGAVCLP